jgi:Transposase IS66 family
MTLDPLDRHAERQKMIPYFEDMKAHAEKKIEAYSSKSGIARSFSYFLKNYESLTHFLEDPKVPIDNNAS